MSLSKDSRSQTAVDRTRYIILGIVAGVSALGYWWYQHWQQPTQAIIEALQPAAAKSSPTSQAKESTPPVVKASNATPEPRHSGLALIPLSEREPLHHNTLGMTFLPLCRYADGKTVWLAVHETRIQDYATYLQRSSHHMQGSLSTAWEEIGKSMAVASGLRKKNSDGSDHPVSYVDGEDATAFCTWLTTEERRQLSTQDTYRLPTEEEWTLAATDLQAKDTPFPWGTTYPPEWDAGNMGLSIDGYAATAPVKEFPANKSGYYDLCGNVREICVTATKGYVWCGSNWSTDDKDSMLISHRTANSGQQRSMGAGFRCVLERYPPSQAKAQR